MERYEIKRFINNETVIIINRVESIDDLVLSNNDFIWDTMFECGVML